MLSVAYAQECPLIATGCSPSYANGVQTSSIFLLVLDEPTNGLDPIGIEELRDQIRGFAAAGTTVVVSSHILSEVQQMADTIGIIYGGRLAYEDALRPGQDLEELFMSVCREGQRTRGEVAA